jgi:hypothetical protein
MKRVAMVLWVAGVAAAGGCGKDKDGGGGGGGGGAGASCADAAASYVAYEMADKYGKLAKLAPTPERLQALTALVQTHCETGTFENLTDTPWKGATRTCVVAAKPPATMTTDDPLTNCFKKNEAKGFSLSPAQIVHMFVEGEKAKAAPPPPPPPPAPTPTPAAP